MIQIPRETEQPTGRAAGGIPPHLAVEGPFRVQGPSEEKEKVPLPTRLIGVGLRGVGWTESDDGGARRIEGPERLARGN